MPIELFPMSKIRMEIPQGLISHYAESPSPALPKGRELNPAEFKDVEALLLPLGRALKNYHYFHFIGVVRRHYRAFTRRSGYDVW